MLTHQMKLEPMQEGYLGQAVTSDVVAPISSVSFWVPDYICRSAWIEHAPFAFWLCEALQPRRFVELGTHYGYSYFAFCQAIDRLGLGTAAYAVDTWKGDEHAGFYDESVFRSAMTRNNEKYLAFSNLLRSTFDDALDYFADGSVDLLHIDGRHFYNDVEHDFALWRPKLTGDAVVLFHDTNVREREFGVWKFFEKLAAQHPSFQFFHGYGLGVLAPGDRAPAPLTILFEASRETTHQIRAAYASLGAALTMRAALAERQREIEAQNIAHTQSLGEIEALTALMATTVSERDEALAAVAERQREIEALKALMATTANERDKAVADLAAGLEELVSSRSSLAEASRRADEVVTALQSAEAKLAKRDDALSRAERELSDRNTANAALQSEIIELRGSLAAARDVGRAALAALRIEPATVPETSRHSRNAGWRALVLRPFGSRGRDPLLVGR